MEIIKVSKFIITAKGTDGSENDNVWELKNEFYFGGIIELQTFQTELKNTFENFIGPVTIEAIEEQVVKIPKLKI